MSLDRDASDRTFDRQLAYLGLLDDAAPIFREGPRFPVSASCSLCRVWSHSGLLRIARKLYGEIGPAFYGLRTTLLTLLLMALLRIKRPEHLKERDPAALGRLLGLDRAPEVKTLRRQLTRLAAHHCAEQLGAELARVRVDSARTAHGVLVRRRPCARLSRPTRDRIKGLRGAPPSGHARQHRLLDQRPLRRSVAGDHRRGQRRR